ncbi:MAG: tail fiber protein [Anaerocolumna sp.]
MYMPFIGQIELLPADISTLGWIPCNGSVIPIRQNIPLYSLIGNKFGGDGFSNFAVPDFRDIPADIGKAYYIAALGIYPLKE